MSYLKCSFVVLAAALTALLPLAPGAAADPDRIEIHQPIPSSAMILTAIDAKSVGQGSGFLVDRSERLLVTNHHVAKAGQNVVAMFPAYDAGQVLVNRQFYLTKAPRIRGKTLASDAQRDLSLIQLESVPNEVPELKLAARLPKAGDKAHLLGNPARSSQAWVYGFGKVEELSEFTFNFAGQRVNGYYIILATEDRKIGAGASGGPVIDDRGELIGVIQSGPPDDTRVNCVAVSEVRVFLSEFHRGQGTDAIKTKDYRRATDCCTKALSINPYNSLAYNERGVAHAFQQDLDSAIADYTKAIQLEPKMARFYRNRASALYSKSKFEEAAADLGLAIRHDPNHAGSYLFRSNVYAKLNRPADSKADYEKAIKLDPSLKK